MTDILMIGLLLVGGYYLLSSGALGTLGGGTTTTTAPTYTTPGSTTVTTPFSVPFEQVAELFENENTRVQACANWRTSDENADRPCENECGTNGNGYKCNNCMAACDQAGQYELKYVTGEYGVPDTDRCATLWKNSCVDFCGVNGNATQCANCEKDCGTGAAHRFPGQRTQTLRGLCNSQGGEWDLDENCCDCHGNTISQVNCCSGTGSTTRTPLKASKTTPGAKTPARTGSQGTQKSRSESSGGGVGGPSRVVPGTPKKSVSAPKPAPANTKCPNGKSFANCPKCKSQCNSPGTFDACCKAASSYARSYLAGSSNRFGPGYTGRDNFVDELIASRVIPSPVDFPYESAKKPYYLGPISPERAALNRRFFANMAITIA